MRDASNGSAADRRDRDGISLRVKRCTGQDQQDRSVRVRRIHLGALSLGLVLSATAPRVAHAAPPEPEPHVREAAQRFQRGVTLYAEADYRAALGEFRRAYLLAPSAAALYNIGETEYQLQDYAGALTSFERYLESAGANEGHRQEVEASVQVLRARVGYLSISTDPAGADLTVDDQPVGKTPLETPLRVSIGRRKVVASLSGGPLVTRYVDVAADDHLSLALPLSAPPSTSVAPPQSEAPPVGAAAPPPSSGGTSWRSVGWVSTGVLAAGAVTFAILASKQSSDLNSARHVYPTTSDPLRHDARVLTTYAVLADSLAAAAVVVGGLTLYFTLSSHEGRAPAHTARLRVGPTSLGFETSF